MNKIKRTALAALAAIGLAGHANAHTVDIGWVYENNGDVTFYAETYHGLGEVGGLGNTAGGLILGGTTYNFTTSILIGSVPTYDGVYESPTYTSDNEQFAQVVSVSGLTAGSYSLTTTTNTVIEWPWRDFPTTIQLNPTVSAVPLPAAGVLLVGALGGLGLMRRRKKS